MTDQTIAEIAAEDAKAHARDFAELAGKNGTVQTRYGTLAVKRHPLYDDKFRGYAVQAVSIDGRQYTVITRDKTLLSVKHVHQHRGLGGSLSAAFERAKGAHGAYEADGVEYALTERMIRTYRVFPGWRGSVADGEVYIDEFSAPAIDDEGNRVMLYWHINATKGSDAEPDQCPGHDDIVSAVVPQ